MRKLFNHQVIGAFQLALSPALLLGDEMRLGKTVQVIAAAEAMYKQGRLDRVLVSKISYIVGKPQRWDLFVFRHRNRGPEGRKRNLIKRIVGLPG